MSRGGEKGSMSQVSECHYPSLKKSAPLLPSSHILPGVPSHRTQAKSLIPVQQQSKIFPMTEKIDAVLYLKTSLQNGFSTTPTPSFFLSAMFQSNNLKQNHGQILELHAKPEEY